MKNDVTYKDLGIVDYKTAWDIQKDLFSKLIEAKRSTNEKQSRKADQHFIVCEHPHVFTLGKSGSSDNLLVNKSLMEEKGISFYHIERGGDITYHGPGQIVGYPILDLERCGIGVRKYIFNMEEMIIRVLAEYGIEAGRLEEASGVWLDPGVPGRERKICAIGVKTSRWVTMHGFAFNVNTNLDFYNYINPCGFTTKGVTSMQKELGRNLDTKEVQMRIKSAFEQVYGCELTS